MITLWNRRELMTTFSMERQAEVRRRLAARGIPYTVRTVSRGSASLLGTSRARTGTMGQNMDMNWEYIIWVRKKDYDEAAAVINGELSR